VPVDRAAHYAYPKETGEARKNRETYMHRQFGLDKRGQRPKGERIKPWYDHYARGGRVRRGFARGGRIPGFQAGGATTSRRRGTPPRTRTSRPTPHITIPRGLLQRSHRLGHLFSGPFGGQGVVDIDSQVSRLTSLMENVIPGFVGDYEADDTDAGLFTEDYYDPAGNIQWSQVDVRKSEINKLLADIARIEPALAEARNLITSALNKIIAELKRLKTERDRLLRRARRVLRHVNELRRSLEHEQHKKKKDHKLINRLSNELQSEKNTLKDLGGFPDKLIETPGGAGGQLGSVDRTVTSLIKTRDETISPYLDTLAGAGTRRSGGLIQQYANARAQLQRELTVDLSAPVLAAGAPGGGAATGATGPSGMEQASAVFAAIASLRNEFLPNYRVLATRHTGGSIPQTGAYWLERGEEVRSRAQVVEDRRTTDNSKNITLIQHYAAPPPDPLPWSRSALIDLQEST
jgi:hypothetical protein